LHLSLSLSLCLSRQSLPGHERRIRFSTLSFRRRSLVIKARLFLGCDCSKRWPSPTRRPIPSLAIQIRISSCRTWPCFAFACFLPAGIFSFFFFTFPSAIITKTIYLTYTSEKARQLNSPHVPSHHQTRPDSLSLSLSLSPSFSCYDHSRLETRVFAKHVFCRSRSSLVHSALARFKRKKVGKVSPSLRPGLSVARSVDLTYLHL
jgi:hypothetical protein